mmetsp:Transcript_12069/g.38661  ORF Transcript_12069/g.38661 Transcript_12069/m.38661 type:complete len:209 (-) Transcript_12069:775-1401(-)
MVVDGVGPVEEASSALAAAREREREQARRRGRAEAAADPVPELEEPRRRVDAPAFDLVARRSRRAGDEVRLDDAGLALAGAVPVDDPRLDLGRVPERLRRTPALGDDNSQGLGRIQAADRVIERHGVHVREESHVQGSLVVVRRLRAGGRAQYELGAEVAPTDADDERALEGLAAVARDVAAAHAVDELEEPVADVARRGDGLVDGDL